MNSHLVENPDKIPVVDDLIDNHQNTYGLNTSILQSILRASYEDGLQGHRARNLLVQPPHAVQVQFLCQLFHDVTTLNYYMRIRMGMTSLIVPPGTIMTKTILALIASTYCLSTDIARSALQFVLISRPCTKARNPDKYGCRFLCLSYTETSPYVKNMTDCADK